MDHLFTKRSPFGVPGVEAILGYFRNWARSYHAWVTCLNDRQQTNAGPHPCSPTLVTVNRDDLDEVRYMAEYYLLGQISKYVRRGARRIASDGGSPRTIIHGAFLNPDGTVALVVVNQTRREQPFAITSGDVRAETRLPAETVATYTWPG
jgi:glucosylceramidase